MKDTIAKPNNVDYFQVRKNCGSSSHPILRPRLRNLSPDGQGLVTEQL